MGDIDNKALYPGWETVRKIGTGSFGTVYEIQRDLFGKKEKAALKLISIPQNESEIDDLYGSGFDDASITAHFQNYLADIVREYSLMAEMKGHTNVVYCDDIRYIQHDDGFGWDIYIKMELLTPMMKALGREETDEQVIKLGRDICNALVLCKSRNIIHRDIKPQNIFISNDGDYKLGDFGIAKTAEKTSGGTKIGTYNYMAPEVYNNEPYGHAADIYSLGLVMYWLLNERRMPFNPPPPAVPTASEMEEARLRRFRGEPVPAPAHGSEALKRIVLKACAYDPKDRYQSAAEMLSALEGLGKPAGQEPVFPVQPAEENDDPTEGFGWKAKAPEPEENKTVGAWTKPENEPEPEEEKTVGAWTKPENEPEPEEEKTVGAWTKPENEPEPEEEKTVGAGAKPKDEPEPEEEKTVSTWAKPEPDKPAPAPTPEKKSGKKKRIGIVAACLALVLVAGGIGMTAFGKTNETANETVNGPSDEKSAPIVAVSAGAYHTVGLRADGTFVALGYNDYGQCDVSDWSDIGQFSAGGFHTVGLRADGTVAAVGYNDYGQCEVSGWRDIVSISAGFYHTVGLHADGTVVAVGENDYGQCEVSDWRDIVSVSVGAYHTVGMRADGTVVAAGCNDYGQCDVSGWRDIVSISAGHNYTVGLCADGTVVAVGKNDYGQCDVSDWCDIVSISAGAFHTAALRADSTVTAVGYSELGQCEVSDWRDIVSISAGAFNTVGLHSDGTLVAVGDNNEGQCDVSDW